MQEFWKIAVGLAGLGAIVSFVVWSVYKQWLQLPIFQTMTKKQQFMLFRLVIILTFLFGLAGLAIYAILNGGQPKSGDSKSLVVLVESYTRKQVLEALGRELQGISNITIDYDPIRSDWLHEADIIGRRAPSIVITHFHALRGINKRGHLKSEEDLLIGLSRIRCHEPGVWFVIYSRGFSLSSKTDNMRQIHKAAARIYQRDPGQRTHMDMVVERIKTAYWGEQPSDEERQALFKVVDDLSK